jgi:hypothetical protein
MEQGGLCQACGRVLREGWGRRGFEDISAVPFGSGFRPVSGSGDGQGASATIDTNSAWLYPQNSEYRIYFASASTSECYTTHMGDTPGPHRSLTVPTPSGRRVSKAGRRQGSTFVTIATPICYAPHQGSVYALRSCHQVGTPANQGFHALCLPWEPQLHERDRPWKPGRVVGDSPDTRRTLAVDNFDTPGRASRLRCILVVPPGS